VKASPFLARWTAYQITGPEDGVQANVALFPFTSTAASADELIRAQAPVTASAKRAKPGIWEGPSLLPFDGSPHPSHRVRNREAAEASQPARLVTFCGIPAALR
jgi:hypothetical protein